MQSAASQRAEASHRLVVDLYQKLTNEEDARVCADISDAACRETPGNFFLLLLTSLLTKLGDSLASPKTTLAWLVSAVGAPPAILGMLVPIRESGSLIPQLFIGGVVRQLSVRKWVWVAGAIVQGACVVCMGLVTWKLTGSTAGWAILAALIVFSLARGFCSVASKDVLGKTIPKGRRGQLTGWSAGLAGLLALGFGALLLFPEFRNLEIAALGWVLVIAGLLWFAAALTYARVVEYPGDTAGGANAFLTAVKSLQILRDDPPFRRFLIVRALLMCSALSAPYYVALAQYRLQSSGALLGLFVAAAGLASLLSAPLWGRFADTSSRRVMLYCAVITALTGILVATVDQLIPDLIGVLWFMPAAYFVLNIAHSGLRVGRKTYVVDLASGDRRTSYVAVGNSVIGIALLLTGLLGTVVTVIGTGGMIFLLSLMGCAGALLCQRLPDA